MDLTDDETPR
jgi:hypothetical protein